MSAWLSFQHKTDNLSDKWSFNKPERIGYRPVRNAALLGVHTVAAAMW